MENQRIFEPRCINPCRELQGSRVQGRNSLQWIGSKCGRGQNHYLRISTFDAIPPRPTYVQRDGSSPLCDSEFYHNQHKLSDHPTNAHDPSILDR